MHRRSVLALFVFLLAAPLFAASDCVGVQRWAVKTTADDEAENIDADPVDTTVAQLVALKRPASLKKTSPRTEGAEETVYVIEATLVTFFSEADQDRHLVLRAGKKFMVGEIPATKCVPDDARFHDEIHDVVDAFDDHFKSSNGTIRKSKKVVNERVRITGVGFFDAPHTVTNAAPNFIELHPVIAIEFLP